jgi:hypothetical protein
MNISSRTSAAVAAALREAREHEISSFGIGEPDLKVVIAKP